jgi:alanine-synthesizing transaminase
LPDDEPVVATAPLALHCITLLASADRRLPAHDSRRMPALASITPSAHLADVRYEIRGALTRRARELEAAGLDIIKLNIGNPGRYGFEVPAHLRETIASHLHQSEAYGHEQGLEIAREAIAAQQRARGARGVDAERIFIGNGVSELIDLALRALLQSGDEVLLPSPDYPLWSAATILNGGTPRYYRCLARHGHLPDPDDIEALITPRTRALVLINPNNPTGAVYPRALLQRLVQIAARHRLLLLADEIYDEILYDDAVFQPLAEVAGELPCLSFGGLSKVHRACGYRVGWMSLSGDAALSADYRDALQLLAALRLCPNMTAQWAVLPALQDAPTISALTAPGGRLHEARRIVLEGVAASDFLELVIPQGALYAFPQVRADRLAGFDDDMFALRLLEEASVLVVPGSSFNVPRSRHFRLTLLPPPAQLREVFVRIEEVLARMAAEQKSVVAA